MVIKSLCIYGRIQRRGDVVVIRKDFDLRVEKRRKSGGTRWSEMR
jgi:hypothetical protein